MLSFHIKLSCLDTTEILCKAALNKIRSLNDVNCYLSIKHQVHVTVNNHDKRCRESHDLDLIKLILRVGVSWMTLSVVRKCVELKYFII